MDHRVLWPGGAVRWLRVRQQIFFSGKSGERHPVHAILAAHDITAEMTVAEAIRTNEAFVRGVLNSLPEHIVVLDDNGVVSAVNESWERFAVMNEGTPSTVSVGANYLEVCRRSSFAGDLYAREALKGLESILAGSFEEFVMEYPCPTPDNKLWFLLFAKRMIKGHQGIILSHVNITERKRAEVELRNTQARLALIVEEVQAGYWDLNLKTKALYVSPEWSRQIGFDANEQTYQWQQKDDRLHPDDRAMVATATENFIAGHLPVYELDFRLRHKNGSYRWIHSRGALLRDSNNQPTRMLGLNLDITDYKRARELNEQRDKMEDSTRLYVASQTAAAIAHEMNQPLTAISYYADVALQLLQTGNENPQKLSRILESCSQQAQRAGQVIRQLMTVLHKGEALNESIDINRSVLDAFDFIRSNDFLRAVKLELNLASILPPVLANALQIQKILINLARNSLESIQENCVKAGSVTATTHIFAGNPAFAQVTVSDNGKGVTDAASLKAMFEPFHTTKATGLGMGLAISRALIEAHGGKMWAEQNAGPGISVHFTLPFVL
jgi:PAS domain S-box-containing protein